MSTAAAPDAFDKLRRAFELAYSAGNAPGLGDLFTEDATLMPPDGPYVNGRAAVVAYYQNWFDQFVPSLSIGTDEVRLVGELGLGRGTFKVTLTPKSGGDPVHLEGKYLNLSQPMADGSWQIVRHIWNTPTPNMEP